MAHHDELTAHYGHGALSDLLPSALSLLGVPGESDRIGLHEQVGDPEKLVILLLDGFGYHLWEEAGRTSDTFAQAQSGRLGTWRALTATSPSSTPISLASLATGTTPGEHGILGFTNLNPTNGEPFTYIYWNRDTDPDPRSWQPQPTIGQRARNSDVDVTIVCDGDFRDQPFSEAIYAGSTWIPARRPDEIITGVREALREPGPGIVFAYLSDIDTLGHVYGVGSDAWHGAVDEASQAVEGICESLPPTAALLVTADHGMVNVDQRLHLDQHPELLDGIQAVCGDPRTRYLHTVSPQAAVDVAATWNEHIGSRGRILTRDEAIDLGWFGPVADSHRSRIGDLVVLCHDDFAVVGVDSEPDAVSALIGQHGGMTAAEMHIPLWSFTRR
ncbi:alkaline phosphatase family protein [Haloglycomyces albus]|uniref:alkaline phosphatase family protein n=1 Tax=Haloglycomyces albus TaxID=526067 RepID=UPI00046CE789|nr:nucleotide pyrophosphatase/phosphodiesterase family protein [Haloglycomyces albus]